MYPILTVAIPTYNRCHKLKFLYDSFLSKVIEKFPDKVEVVICDNSELEKAKENAALLANSGVRYKRNERNIGFSGNMIRCVREARGDFIWVVSDDDDIDFSAFKKFFFWLENSDMVSIHAIMLPFYNQSDSKKRFLVNTEVEWAGKTTLAEMVSETKTLPFVLFSGVIVKNKKSVSLEEIGSLFKDNDYIQIPLFMSLIGSDGRVVFYDKALQEYKSSDVIRFSLKRMVISMEQVLDFMVKYYSFSQKTTQLIYERCHYNRWMSWIVLHKSGQVLIQEADDAIPKLLWKWRCQHFSSVRNFIRFMFSLSPKPVAKFLYEIKNKR